jgi:hypothetical protein
MPIYKVVIDEQFIHTLIITADSEFKAEDIACEFVESKDPNPSVLSHEVLYFGTFGQDREVTEIDYDKEIDETQPNMSFEYINKEEIN